MATYALIHGAGASSWYWHLVRPELEALGHDVVSPDLPCDDDTAGLAEYADVVVDAIGGRRQVVVVAAVPGGVHRPLGCDAAPVDLMVLVAAMVPRPAEAPGEWWTNTGHVFPEPFDPVAVFCHDLTAELQPKRAVTSGTSRRCPFQRPWPLPRLARHTDALSSLQARPLLSYRVPAPGRAAAPRYRARRDGQWSSAGPRPSSRASCNDWRPTGPSWWQAKSLRELRGWHHPGGKARHRKLTTGPPGQGTLRKRASVEGDRAGRTRLRRAGTEVVRRRSPQDDRHTAGRRLAAHLGHRVRVHRRRPPLRFDDRRSQGRRSQTGSPLRPARPDPPP